MIVLPSPARGRMAVVTAPTGTGGAKRRIVSAMRTRPIRNLPPPLAKLDHLHTQRKSHSEASESSTRDHLPQVAAVFMSTDRSVGVSRQAPGKGHSKWKRILVFVEGGCQWLKYQTSG